METVLSWIFGITTIIGVISTIYYGQKYAKLEKARKRLDWADLQSCANDLGSKIKKEFTPNLIFSPDVRGGTFANLIKSEFTYNIPVYVGLCFWKDSKDAISELKDYRVIETNKWYVHIPETILNNLDNRILIVDDFAMSGDFVDKLKQLLVTEGFEENNIRIACVATTKIALRCHKAPDYYWIQADNDDFYFPWGKAR